MRGAKRAIVAAALAAVMAAPLAHAGSLYAGPGPLPGPPILYAPLAVAPQLQNAPRSVWRAAPILISGAYAYRRGELLYQGFLYDDHGAHEQLDPNDPRISSATFSQPNGDYTYPTNPAYGNNAANLVEFRAKPLKRYTAFRVTFNTMHDPTLIGFTLALGGAPGTLHAFPFGANVNAPASLFLTVHPAGRRMVATLQNAATGKPVGRKPVRVKVDVVRRQIEFDVPHADWNPRRGRVRMALGVGLWNKATNGYLLPGSSATATTPGGAGTASAPPAFFDVAFRTHEPMPDLHEPASVPLTAQNPAWWRDSDLGTALASGDISSLSLTVDFGKLARRKTDNSGVPRTGPMDRIMASHFEPGQGVAAGYSSTCAPGDSGCAYQGQLEPYAIYVPTKPMPSGGYGLTLLLHALLTNYNLYLSSRNESEFAEAGPGSIVLTPEARGPDGSYTGLAATDVFEAMADVAAHYRLNPSIAALSGYSMGGIGTFQLGEQFPDLFAKAFSISGTDNTGMPGNLRNLPILMWNMVADEEVPIDGPEQTANNLNNLGYRYELDEFSPGEHNTFALNDEYGPAAAFLASDALDRDPARVTFSVDPSLDFPKWGLVADHAYWLSGLRPRTTGAMGSIDAFSHGVGALDPTPSGTQYGSGVLTGGLIPAIGYARKYQTWGPVPPGPRGDVIDIKATNLAAATIDPGRADVDCGVKLNIASDGPLTVTLARCGRSVGAG
jgi:hypothetical protein